MEGWVNLELTPWVWDWTRSWAEFLIAILIKQISCFRGTVWTALSEGPLLGLTSQLNFMQNWHVMPSVCVIYKWPPPLKLFYFKNMSVLIRYICQWNSAFHAQSGNPTRGEVANMHHQKCCFQLTLRSISEGETGRETTLSLATFVPDSLFSWTGLGK